LSKKRRPAAAGRPCAAMAEVVLSGNWAPPVRGAAGQNGLRPLRRFVKVFIASKRLNAGRTLHEHRYERGAPRDLIWKRPQPGVRVCGNVITLSMFGRWWQMEGLRVTRVAGCYSRDSSRISTPGVGPCCCSSKVSWLMFQVLPCIWGSRGVLCTLYLWLTSQHPMHT
jgi:hypothetical protein